MNYDEYIRLYGEKRWKKHIYCATPKVAMDTAVVCDVCGRKIFEPASIMNRRIFDYLCRYKSDEIVVSPVIHHHTSYKDDSIMLVCNKCHAKIHFRKECKYKPVDSRPVKEKKYVSVNCVRCNRRTRVKIGSDLDVVLCSLCKKEFEREERAKERQLDYEERHRYDTVYHVGTPTYYVS